MRVVLTNQYRFTTQLDFDNLQTSLEYDYTTLQKKKIKVVKGHAHLQTIQKEFNLPTISVLRQPRERLISHYLYVRTLKENADIAGMSLKEMLHEGVVQTMDNCMVRYFCGRTDKPYGAVGQEDLEEALENLYTRIDLFGVLEHFDEFMVDCSKLLNWKRVYYFKENAFKGNKNLLVPDEETEKLIARYTRFGCQLYAVARAEVEQRIADNADFYESEKARIKRWNRVYSTFKQTKRIFGLK